MPASRVDPVRVNQHHRLRAVRLKRRLTIASVLGFATFFGLAAQHVVRSSVGSTRQAARATERSAPSTTFFDQQDSGFSFEDTGSALSPDLAQSPAPMAQTSVS